MASASPESSTVPVTTVPCSDFTSFSLRYASREQLQRPRGHPAEGSGDWVNRHARVLQGDDAQDRFGLGWAKNDLHDGFGDVQSMAPVSTRNSASHGAASWARLDIRVVTWVTPMSGSSQFGLCCKPIG